MSHCLILNANGSPLGLLPVSAKPWQKVIPEVFTNKVQVLHEYEDWIIRSPSISLAVPAVVVLNQFCKPKENTRFTPSMLKLRDDNTCRYCGGVFENRMLTLDHVIPESHGGKRSWDNIVAACGPCNNRRGNNARIKPSHAPYRPSYWELVGKMKKNPLKISHPSWAFYIDWPQTILVPPSR